MLMGVSSQKISVRLKRTVAHMATQTEALSWPGSEGPSSHFVLSSPRKTAQDTLYVLPSPTSPCPSPVLVRKRAFVKWENKESFIKSKEELRHLRLPTYQELEQVPSFFFFCRLWESGANQGRTCKLKIPIRLIIRKIKGKKRKRGKKRILLCLKETSEGPGSLYISRTGQTGLPVAIKVQSQSAGTKVQSSFHSRLLEKNQFLLTSFTVVTPHPFSRLKGKLPKYSLPRSLCYIIQLCLGRGLGGVLHEGYLGIFLKQGRWTSCYQNRLFSSLHRKPPPQCKMRELSSKT